MGGYIDVLSELLRRGADVGTPSHMNGESLLAVAVFGSRPAETRELLRYGAWERESSAQREQLLTWASSRRSVAEAFRDAGICDFESILAPLKLPFLQHGIREPDYPSIAATQGAKDIDCRAAGR